MPEGLPLRRKLNRGPLLLLQQAQRFRSQWHEEEVNKKEGEVISPGQWLLLFPSLEQVLAVGAFETR